MYAVKSTRPADWNRFRPAIFKISFIISLFFCWVVINANFKVSEIVIPEPPVLEELFINATPRTIEKKKVLPPPKPKKKIDPPVIIEPTPDPEPTFERALEIPDEPEEMSNEVGVDTNSYVAAAPAPKLEIPEEIIPDDEPISIAEQMPIFGDCDPFALDAKEVRLCSDTALLRYIQKHLKYPAAAREIGLEGMVVVQFVVDKQGNIEKIKVVRDIGAGCGAVAKKIIAHLPKWLPGKQNGRPVSVFYTVPIKFELR